MPDFQYQILFLEIKQEKLNKHFNFQTQRMFVSIQQHFSHSHTHTLTLLMKFLPGGETPELKDFLSEGLERKQFLVLLSFSLLFQFHPKLFLSNGENGLFLDRRASPEIGKLSAGLADFVGFRVKNA